MSTKAERELISQVLAQAGGDQTAAADLLGVKQGSISRYLSGKHGIKPGTIKLARRILADAGIKPKG